MSAVPGEPIERDTPSGGVRLAQRRQAFPNGWWGMALLLLSEATIFGTMIATYFYLDFGVRHWPPLGISRPEVTYPSIATGVLVLMTVPMWLASRAARAGKRRTVLGLITLAFVFQALYFAAQLVLFSNDLAKFSPKGTAYGSIYYTLLATHHGHVLIGCFLDLAIIWFVARKGLTSYWLTATRGLALYWYVINFLAVLVLLTTLSPSL